MNSSNGLYPIRLVESILPKPTATGGIYPRGEMLIEAYCKSAAKPGQRIVIGETPAAPFRPRMTVDRAW